VTTYSWIGRFRPLLFISLVYLGISFLLRLILWKIFGPAAQVGWGDVFTILAAGILNDYVALIFLNIPGVLYLTFMPDKAARSKTHRGVFALLVFLSIFGMLYLAGVEFFFFQEFDARFNLVAVDYLIYPHEVLINIWESYPVVIIMLVDALLAGLILAGIWPMLARAFSGETKITSRLVFLAGYLVLLIPALLMSTDSLDRSGNRVANELSHNGVSSLFRAFHTNHLDYDAYYRIMDHDKAFALARQELADNGTFVSPDPENLNRTHPADPDGLGRMNVVVIVEESFSGSFCGVFGNTKNLTPRFDRLCARGLLFTNAYASGTRTVRGLEAISTSFPPIPSEAIVKRPGNEGMAGWGRIMNKNGYHSSFLYGGFGTFDNMNAFFSGNGFAISDRMNIENPGFTNIWGVSDGDLFSHALKYYDARNEENRPFFSIIMTTSNHRPYTFPKDIPGIPSEGGGREAGVRYADHALGEFLEQAESHAWFDNTLFVIVADHCARVYGRAEVPVATYHIPLLFYAPGKIPPSNLAWPIGQIDIAPTVLAALGLPYTAPFYGHDIFDQSRDPEKNPLFLNHNHDVAMMVGDTMAVLGLHRSARLFHYDRSNNTQTPLEGDPDTFDRAAAIYQTAYELFREHAYR
jgi:phosphoglycerol transferase MdoB-like AlkP superfamily enzyme